MSGLVWRNLLKHPIRSLLTIGSLTVALFLLCFLSTMLTALEAGVKSANSRRLWVQSAVSLFVDLPSSYQAKIESVEGVGKTCKWQWFGAYYQDQSNFFAQFAVDPQELIDIWPEMKIFDGSAERFLATRNGCIVGAGLAKDFGWKVGDKVPLIGALFPRPDGSAWEFEVAAIYRPLKPTMDDRTFFFQWKFFEESMEEINGEAPDVGVIVIEAEEDADVTAIMASVDGFFENGPQRVQTTTEAEFSRQFVSMMGNIPRLLSFIGSAVLLAILLACVNTMLMAAGEQVRDVGILKALGFTDGAVFRLLLMQSMALCTIGGGAGIALSLLTAPIFASVLARFLPGFEVTGATLALAVGATLAIGLVAGILPARSAARLNSVEALRRGQ